MIGQGNRRSPCPADVDVSELTLRRRSVSSGPKHTQAIRHARSAEPLDRQSDLDVTREGERFEIVASRRHNQPDGIARFDVEQPSAGQPLVHRRVEPLVEYGVVDVPVGVIVTPARSDPGPGTVSVAAPPLRRAQ